MHYSSGLLRQVFTIEFNNLKHVCKFYYKGDLTKNQVLHLKEYDFTMENNDIYIHSLNQQDKWKNNFSSKYVIFESAIIFETGSYEKFDFNIIVLSDLEKRIKRRY